MSSQTPATDAIDLEGLILEIGRYLAAVEVFREEGHEPRWARDEGVFAAITEVA